MWDGSRIWHLRGGGRLLLIKPGSMGDVIHALHGGLRNPAGVAGGRADVGRRSALGTASGGTGGLARPIVPREEFRGPRGWRVRRGGFRARRPAPGYCGGPAGLAPQRAGGQILPGEVVVVSPMRGGRSAFYRRSARTLPGEHAVLATGAAFRCWGFRWRRVFYPVRQSARPDLPAASFCIPLHARGKSMDAAAIRRSWPSFRRDKRRIVIVGWGSPRCPRR